MNASTKIHDTHFGEYVKLLVQLADLMRRGLGDDDEAELVRDRMDDHWYQLDPAQVKLLRGLSADLYSIGVDRQVQGLLGPSERDTFQEMIDGEEWDAVLEFLRRNEEAMPADEVACLRGIAWGNMSQQEPSIEFFDEATRLDPTNPNYRVLSMFARIRAERSNEAMPMAEEIVRSSTDASELLMAAHVLLDVARKLSGESQAECCRRVIEVVRRAQQLVDKVVQDEYLRSRSAFGNLYVAECYARLGERQAAAEAVRKASDLEPDNPIAQEWLRDLENNSGSPDSAFDPPPVPLSAPPVTYPHFVLSIASV
jgi:tetratricopeptide (TPR) repeat protein